VSTAFLEESRLAQVNAIDVDVYQPAGTELRRLSCESALELSSGPDAGVLESVHVAEGRLDPGAPNVVFEGLEPTETFVVARALSESCVSLGAGCTSRQLVSGESATLHILLEADDEGTACHTGRLCVEGMCVPCESDGQCEDEDPCTEDSCHEGSCVLNPNYAPGCGTCVSARGIQHRTSFDALSTGIAAIPREPGVPAPQELVVVAPGIIELHEVPSSGEPLRVAVTHHEAHAPLPPVVVGDWVIVADGRGDLVEVYQTSALRSGDAEAIAAVDEGYGPFTSVAAGDRFAYLATGNALASLVLVDITELPMLPSIGPEDVSSYFPSPVLLALDVGPSGSWLYGVNRRFPCAAQLDEDGRLSGSTIFSHYVGDVRAADLSSRWLFVAGGEQGLTMIDRLRIEDPDNCCDGEAIHEHRLPLDCLGSDCEPVVAAAVAGEDRAVVVTSRGWDPAGATIYLLDVSDPSAVAVVVSAVSLARPAYQGLELLVVDSTVYVAGINAAGDDGRIDVYDLLCPSR